MSIRKYKPTDHAACTEIFKSNCPDYFDATEIDGFEHWLAGQDKGQVAYTNSEAEFFYVTELNKKIIACGGFYIAKSKPNVNMAWGMVHEECHKQGFGKQLFQFRINEIAKLFPEHSVVLDTSQHTFNFFKQFGFSVVKITEDGYGAGLDRYDMVR